MALQIRRDSWDNDRQFDEVQQLAHEIEHHVHRFINGGSYTTTQRNALTGFTALNQGVMVYDSTLGHPIWLHSVDPLVWHDATGAAV